jgi:hypothetical protein
MLIGMAFTLPLKSEPPAVGRDEYRLARPLAARV